MARSPLILVTLNPDQIAKAKEVNGRRKRITHALLCGPYGQIFGTEKQCLKYWSAWNPKNRIEVTPGRYTAIFPKLFDKAVKKNKYEIHDFESTFNLVNKLIAAEDATKAAHPRHRQAKSIITTEDTKQIQKPRLENRNTDKSGFLGLVLVVLFVVILILVNIS